MKKFTLLLTLFSTCCLQIMAMEREEFIWENKELRATKIANEIDSIEKKVKAASLDPLEGLIELAQLEYIDDPNLALKFKNTGTFLLNKMKEDKGANAHLKIKKELEAIEKLAKEHNNIPLLNALDINVTYKFFSLFLAANISQLNRLIELGLDVDLHRYYGKTPLMLAIQMFSISKIRKPTYKKITELFINAGADVNAQDDKERTPLHHLMLSELCDDLAKLLLEKGADPTLKDSEGKTPLDLLKEMQKASTGCQSKEVEKLLKEHMKK